jgi:hypothetical protein
VPYWLETDAFADDPIWQVLGGGKADVEDRLQSAYCRLKAKTSHLRDNGYVTEATALTQCRGRRPVLELLCTPVLERPALLHRPGDTCSCLGGEWIDGFAYRIHDFLKRNPSRAEHDRAKAQRADLRNARLKALVYERDGGCCRYCRSGPLSNKAGRSRDRRKALVYDHIDPDAPAGEDGANLVTACAACNEHKGKRTPYEADMVLLAPPTDAERVQWRDRPLQLHDRPVYDPADLARATDANTRPITDESPTNHRQNSDSVADPNTETVTDPLAGPNTDHDTTTAPETGPEQAQQTTDHPHHEPEDPLGSGRVGRPAVGDPQPRPAQPDRTGEHPDIYHRRSRASPGGTAPPEYIWPPGSTRQRPVPPTGHAPPRGVA